MNPISRLLVTFLVTMAALTTASRAEVTVSNVTATQRPGTKLVDITYDVSSTAHNRVAVSLVVSNGATPINSPSVSGAVGPGVATGTGLTIVWDAGADWAGNVATGVAFCVTADDAAIGDFYQGGIIAYILQPGDRGYIAGEVHGLIAAPSDQGYTDWGCYGISIGLTSTVLGSGAINTAAIVAGCSTAGIPARICDDLDLNGYSDWYLPSSEELNKLLINRQAIGGFSTSLYVSSSEAGAERAVYQDFSTGSQFSLLKLGYGVIRAVRSMNVTSNGGIISGMPEGGDPKATGWDQVNVRWVKNRYADGAVTMSDRITGLMWFYDANANGKKNCLAAGKYCNSLVYAGHSGWYVPSMDQLKLIFSQLAFTSFANVQSELYWSSTPYSNSSFAVSMSNGTAPICGREYELWIWPCRQQ